MPFHRGGQLVDVSGADENVGIDALPRHDRARVVDWFGTARLARAGLEQAVVDGGALDVEQVDAVVLCEHLKRRVREADAHCRRHRDRLHGTTVSGPRPGTPHP